MIFATRPDRVERQRNNAKQAFQKAHGRLTFRVGSHFVRGVTRNARDVMGIIKGQDVTLPFLNAFLEHCEAQGHKPHISLSHKKGDHGQVHYVTLTLPGYRKK